MCPVLVTSQLILSTRLPTSEGWTAELTVGLWLMFPNPINPLLIFLREDDVIDQPDSTKIGYNHSSLEESKKNKDNSNVAKQVDDIFADEDDLPG